MKETDLQAGALQAERTYFQTESQSDWYFPFDQTMHRSNYNGQTQYVYKRLGNTYFYHQASAGCWKTSGQGCIDIREADGLAVMTDGRSEKHFDLETGHMMSVHTYQDRRTVHFDYQPASVTMRDARSELVFGKDSDSQVTSVSNGDVSVSYHYGDNGLISGVTRPDGGTTSYRYGGEEETRLTQSEANGQVDHTWTYDEKGRVTNATRGERATSSLTYGTDRITVTNSLGKETVFHFSTHDNAKKISSIEGTPSLNCKATQSEYTYYETGLVETMKGNAGAVTQFEYNDRGLETTRVEALGQPDERRTETTWIDSARLPKQITTGNKTVEFSYDSLGHIISKTVRSRD
ncbi:RHS repeat protein [Marinobacter bohaiensis]|uniref:RHS repeat protein n=1 Tax=Marinobacter bohaiensis TaxID=2201898 RepID=UPI000DAC6AED|nr:RHS repeat protein [Marinobacter bohaiensis]